MSTQKYVDVEEVRNGAIVLKNGSLRGALLVSSVNFDLKSSEEQDATIMQYQNFLNSLDFPVQILIQSRRFNVEPYLAILKQKEKQQENELLRFQISEYQNFIAGLIDTQNVISKFFYVIVPFSPVETEAGGFFTKIGSIFSPKQTLSANDTTFEMYRSQLYQRMDHVSAALTATGVRVAPLGTEELIELLYNSYNPSLFTSEVIRDIGSVELSDKLR
jgi:type IV secretory pathway VirB4 component